MANKKEKEFMRKGLWDNIGVPDEKTLEHLMPANSGNLIMGSSREHQSIYSLLFYEENPYIVNKHLMDAAAKVEDNQAKEWFDRAVGYFNSEAEERAGQEHPSFPPPKAPINPPSNNMPSDGYDDNNPVIPVPEMNHKKKDSRRWWNYVVGGALALTMGVGGYIAGLRSSNFDVPVNDPEPPIVDTTKRDDVQPDIERIVNDQNIYVVQPGDTLSRIAAMFLGEEHDSPTDAYQYALFLAEQNNIDPNLIFPGQEITIFDNVVKADNDIELPVVQPEIALKQVGPNNIVIGHEDTVCDAIWNYGVVPKGTIPGVEETIVTDMLGVPGIGERINEWYKENCSTETAVYGTNEQSTTNPITVPIDVRNEADIARYGNPNTNPTSNPKNKRNAKKNSIDDVVGDDGLEQALIGEEDYIPKRGYGDGGFSLRENDAIQLGYVMSKYDAKENDYSLSEHNLKQVIRRGENISSAYEMHNHGMTANEIAMRLGKSKSTVYKYIREAKNIESAGEEEGGEESQDKELIYANAAD
ncbi:MAG: LysM peptidoglycan-binding domain-containing protein [Candidatus Woesearchaeota archaeon]